MNSGWWRRGGWWQRNWWGLLAVLPLLAAIVVLSPTESYQAWRDAQPRPAPGPDQDGWVDYAGARVRLAELTPVELREPGSGEPFPLPPGVQAWQATVTIGRLADPDRTLSGCQFLLEDDAGRLFGDGPSEAREARLGEAVTSYQRSACRPEEEAAADAETFEAVALFVLPSSARPVAVRLTAIDQLPVYARLEVG